MDNKYLQDIKEYKHLTAFGISQDIVEEAKKSSQKYLIKPNFKLDNSMESLLDILEHARKTTPITLTETIDKDINEVFLNKLTEEIKNKPHQSSWQSFIRVKSIYVHTFGSAEAFKEHAKESLIPPKGFGIDTSSFTLQHHKYSYFSHWYLIVTVKLNNEGIGFA